MTFLRRAMTFLRRPPCAPHFSSFGPRSWIADYFDDAGYQDWEKASVIYKSMLMSAFPPIDPLDEKKPDYTTMSIEEIEEARSRWMRGIHALQQHTAGPPSPLS